MSRITQPKVRLSFQLKPPLVNRKKFLACVAGGLTLAPLFAAFVPAANAETKELRLGRQLGLGYLQFYVMEDQKLVEKHAKKEGLNELTVTYKAIGSPATLNDSILSGNLDFVSAAPPQRRREIFCGSQGEVCVGTTI